jgi:hypothetical protein
VAISGTRLWLETSGEPAPGWRPGDLDVRTAGATGLISVRQGHKGAGDPHHLFTGTHRFIRARYGAAVSLR